ncbi:uncharacterized protein LOC119726059 [Patiria miniata]|uniref:Uncharacterized protein n=1 Tax=Patiria miniata TaxID=46514 RepID=A0A913ZQE8_PATMI|nr:uncharacterized protein LOC119726059 [Patiria miniata]
MKWTFLLVCFSLFLSSGWALNCYHCSGSDNPDKCKDQFDYDVPIQNCTANQTACMKVKERFSGVVARRCATLETCGLPADTRFGDCKTFATSIQVCCFRHELSNSATTWRVGAMVVATIVLLAHYLK